MNILETSVNAAKKIESQISAAFRKYLLPPPDLDLVEWADEYRYLPSNSAEPGRWKTARVEPARQPMLSISNPEVTEVTVMCAIQFMKTELMLNAAMYYMHQEPSPIIYVAPKKETAEAWSKERLVQSVNATPVLHDIFTNNRRGEGNTISQKQYPGGQISIVSARNPTDLAMRACRIVLLDEIDKYPLNVGAGEAGAGGEGDPIAVVWGRATTYGDRAKKVCACSPTIEGRSRIEAEYKQSNQGIFLQKCPHCSHKKYMVWADVKIPKNKKGRFIQKEAHIVCSECKTHWSESDRLYSIRNGEWHFQRPEITWHHGYKANSLSSPFTPIPYLAKEFVKALDNAESLKAFYNTRMAETWRETGDRPEWKDLYNRRENYKIKTIPKGGLMLVCGIDVQKGYMVYEVVAYGRFKENWSIDKGVIEGDIESEKGKTGLTKLLDSTYKNCSGINVPIMKANIDTGYNTQEVYSFVRGYGADRLTAVKGGGDEMKTILGTPKPMDIRIDGARIANGLMLWPVGSGVIKEQLYRWFNLEKPTDEEFEKGAKYPPGYCHFPMWDQEYFEQTCSEQLVTETDRKGFKKYIWKKMRTDNHLLDCKVYARSAAAMLQIDRMNESDWKELEGIYHPKQVKVEKSQPVNDNPRNHKTRRSGWLKRK